MKRCKVCEQDKDEGGFYSKDRTCKDCRKRMIRERYKQTLPARHAYDQSRSKTEKRKRHAVVASKKQRERNPEKYAARTALNNAVRDGWLRRMPCRCGNPKSQAHHHDYSKPFDVEWVCFKCHREGKHGQRVG